MPLRSSRVGLVVVVLVVAARTATGGWAAPEGLVAAGWYGDVRSEVRGAVSAATAEGIGRYAIDAVVDVGTGTIGGEERVDFVNGTGRPLAEVWFRLFPNAWYYGEGGVEIGAVRVEGEAVTPEFAVDGTAMRVPLPAAIEVEEEVAIEIGFVTAVPLDSTGSYGIFKRDSIDGTWILADWYPIVAGYENEGGWNLDEPTVFGDPTFAESALYDVAVTAPAGWRVVTSGRGGEEEDAEEGLVRRYVAGPARDFTMVLDDDWVKARTEVGGTTVTAWAEPEQAAASEAALGVAATALGAYGERFGAYPFGELELVGARLAGALGVSWAGVIFLDGPGMYGGLATENPEVFASVVAHEVGHQWWGGSVGTNSNDHAFLTEGLTNYLSVVFLEWTAGAEAAARQVDGQLAGGARRLLERYGDGVADVPIAAGQEPGERSAVFYGKSALGFLAIRNEIGDGAFFGGLRVFAEEFAFEVAEPADLLGAFEAAAGRELDELWRHWFEAAEMTFEEIAATVAGS